MIRGRTARTVAALLAVAAAAALLIADGGGGGGTATQAPKSAHAEAIPADQRTAIGATLRLIDAGGPFASEQDGTVFSNREGRLPAEPQGYYREYTVPTPGSPDRGARRLVTGEGGELYYTDDHYESFTEIDPREFQ